MSDLKTWGETLFYPDYIKKGKKGKEPKRVRAFSSKAHEKDISFFKARLKGVVEKHPQVMVKITGGNHSFKEMAAHMDYIGRNGKVELETEQGEFIDYRLNAEQLSDMWHETLMDDDGKTKWKQNYHVMFSMPEGTDRREFGIAARQAVYELFGGNHQFILAEHHDTPHPHIHVCVKAVGYDGTRLKTKKQDLQRWREVFAERLRERGIKAEATRRQVRGQFKKAEPSALKQMKKNNPSAYRKYQKSDDLGLKQKEAARAGRPYKDTAAVAKARRTRKHVEAAYEKIIRELENGDSSDKKLAKELQLFVNSMDGVKPKAEAVYRQEKARIEREQGRGLTR